MPAPQEITLSFSDRYTAFARLWLPDRPRGSVLYLHGIQSHGGWYETSAARLAAGGWCVLMPDRRGSGRNQQDRGHAPSPRRLLQDAVECLNRLGEQIAFDTAHVVGVSWGGKLALGLRRFAPARVASLTLVAPGLFPLVDLPMMAKVRVGLSILAAPRALFEIPLSEPELFTGNAARQQFIRDDPLKLTRVTTRFLLTSRQLDRYGLTVRNDPTGCPLCVFLAGRDRIIDNQRTRDFVRRLRWIGRTIIEYPDAHHTLEFEPDPEPYLSDLVEWLDGVAPRR